MNIITALTRRASTRAFLDRPVAKNLIEQILDAARWAPSGTNTQPWNVAVVSGKNKQQLCQKILTAYQAGQTMNPDYLYYPKEWFEPYKSRRFACGMALYNTLNIKREDKQKRQEVWELNYQAFGAPVVLFFFIDRKLAQGSWFDYGMFFQSVMLAALEFDLATCPQAALGEYPDIVRDHLGAAYQDKILLCGMALGYPDKTAIINSYRTQREPVANFCQWFD